MKNVDSVDQDQTAQKVQSDLNLHCPQKLLLSSSVRKDLTPEKQNDILGLLTNVHTYRNMKPGFPSITQIVLFFFVSSTFQMLTLYLSRQFLALPIQQRMKI